MTTDEFYAPVEWWVFDPFRECWFCVYSFVAAEAFLRGQPVRLETRAAMRAATKPEGATAK